MVQEIDSKKKQLSCKLSIGWENRRTVVFEFGQQSTTRSWRNLFVFNYFLFMMLAGMGLFGADFRDKILYALF